MTGADAFRARFGAHVPRLLGSPHSYAVLCPLVEGPDGLRLLFEVRAATLQRQPGEVCFPGGRMEPGETAEVCALRETEEELSISPGEIELLGRADFICSPQGFLLQPVVGLISARGFASLRPSPDEVAEAFTVPMAFFAQNPPAMHYYDLRPDVPADFPYDRIGFPQGYTFRGNRVEEPIWNWGGHAIWGMTARITRQLAETVKKD